MSLIAEQDIVNFINKGDLKEAEQAAISFVKIHPSNPNGFHLLGVVRGMQGNHLDAETSLLKAITLQTKNINCWVSLTTSQIKLDKNLEALTSASDSISSIDGLRQLVLNRAIAAGAVGDFESSITDYKFLLTTNPEDDMARYFLAMDQLAVGKFQEGWTNYESRLNLDFCSASQISKKLGLKIWQGESIKNSKLLVFTEQGIGDGIQFLRFLEPLSQVCDDVTLRAPKHLHHLLSMCPLVKSLVGEKDNFSRYDFCVSIMSLPKLLGIYGTLSISIPYLKFGPNQKKLESNKKLVGISWRGSPTGQQGRSIDLNYFRPLAELSKFELVSLQKDPTPEEQNLAETMNIRVLPGLDSDNDAFKGSLELLQHIDVLVTCDSALGHIAGALGIKTYLLLKKYPDWRWCAAEQIEPWYPLHNLRIQDEENEWGKTLTNLALELSNE